MYLTKPIIECISIWQSYYDLWYIFEKVVQKTNLIFSYMLNWSKCIDNIMSIYVPYFLKHYLNVSYKKKSGVFVKLFNEFSETSVVKFCIFTIVIFGKCLIACNWVLLTPSCEIKGMWGISVPYLQFRSLCHPLTSLYVKVVCSVDSFILYFLNFYCYILFVPC